MNYIVHVFYGLVMAYIGLISPGMLNMTALKIRIHSNKIESVKFALGASLVVFFQAGIALFFADYFASNPKVIENLKIAAVFVFFSLALFFFFLSRKKMEVKATDKNRNYFLRGMGMSSCKYVGDSILFRSEYIFSFFG